MSEIKKLKVVGLDSSMPKNEIINGELHTNSVLFLMKRCLLQLQSRIDQLELEIAEMKGQVEPD